MAELTAEELAAVQAKAPAHAKRFERIETVAGTIVLCNASRQQVRASRSSVVIGPNMTMNDNMTANEGLFLAMCVQPDTAAAKALLEDWPQLLENSDVTDAMGRLNGASKKT